MAFLAPKQIDWAVSLAAIFAMAWVVYHWRRFEAEFKHISWHVAHSNTLKLTRTKYTVPLTWQVHSGGPSYVFLMAGGRMRTPSMVSLREIDRLEDDPPFQTTVEWARESFTGGGKLILERKWKNSHEEVACFEGTQQELPDDYVVRCLESAGTLSMFSGDRNWVDSYYNIIKSARSISDSK